MKIFLTTVLIFLTASFAHTQYYKVTGKITDAKDNKPLSYSTIKVADSSYGTTSDNSGEYILRLKAGRYKIIFSYIGYFSDTADVTIENSDLKKNIFLNPSDIFTEAIEVEGEDPSYEIIRKAIKYKKQFKNKLDEYNYEAYTKFIIRSNVADKDTTEKKENSEPGIAALLESETKGYVKKPDVEKQIVKSKRESANITQGFALPYVVNFYDEKVDLGELKIPGPLNDEAFDSYDYKLRGTTSLDSNRVFKIEVINTSSVVPQFLGNIYIVDSVFALVKVNLRTNNAAKLRFVDNIDFFQKFVSYSDKKKNNFWMPADVEIFADGSFAGLIKFRAEVFTIISSYNLNEKAPAGIFDDVIIKVLPDAGKKDSTYWNNNRLLTNTAEEKKAYKNIEKNTKEDENKIYISPFGMKFGKYITSNPLSYYKFNRIEGSHLQFDLDFTKDFDRYNAKGYFGYGFSDKKSKYELSATGRFLKDKSLTISASTYKRLNLLFQRFSTLDELYNTFIALFDKQDESNYYYTSGYSLSISKRIISQFTAGLHFSEETQTSAYKNTDYSIRKRDVLFRENPLINESFTREIGISLRLNPNVFKYIDWGTGEISAIRQTNYPFLDLRFDYSPKDFLKSTNDFRKFSATLFGNHYINSYLNFRYRLAGIFTNGSVPFQELGNFNIKGDVFSQGLSFMVTHYFEYIGDRVYYLNFENDFGKILWGNLPILKKCNLIGFVNAGRTEFANTGTIYSRGTEGIYVETGFSISRILDVMRINVGWRLNNYYPGSRNFNINLSIEGF